MRCHVMQSLPLSLFKYHEPYYASEMTHVMGILLTCAWKSIYMEDPILLFVDARSNDVWLWECIFGCSKAVSRVSASFGSITPYYFFDPTP